MLKENNFLFNSFNVLSGLIDENPEKAQKFLAGLSKIYRYVLEQRNEETSTVGEELEFAQKYLDLHQMRFENSLAVNTEIDEKTKERDLKDFVKEVDVNCENAQILKVLSQKISSVKFNSYKN